MPFSRGRFAPSAEHAKSGMTVLVPRPIVDAEQRELMGFLTSHKVQNLIIFLRRGGVRHLDINETLRQGEYKGLAPLHVGTMIGTSSVVNALLELANADPDVRTKESLEAPLHIAAKKGDVGMTRALLTHGARPDPQDRGRLTPLLVAAGSAESNKSFHHLVCAELVKHGASVVARDGAGDTALHLACDTELALPTVHEIVLAAKQHNPQSLGEAVEALNIAGEGVLHRACAKRQGEVAQMLIEAGARSDARSSAGDTAMHIASREGLEHIATMLLDLSDPRALNAGNIAGETPLHLAMSANTSKHARIARMLLARGAFAFGRTRSGETVMHACAREGNVQLASLILSRPRTSETVEALNAKANNGGTPLHVAVTHSQEEMVKLLLLQEGIDRGVSDNEGNTPILTACARGDIILLQRLLRAGRGVGPRELQVRNALGWAALHTASFRGQDVAVRMLLRHQAPVDQRTADGWTALHLACAEGQLSCVTSLLASGAQLDAHHASGESALGLAAARGHQKVVTQLLRAGASPAARADDHGWTPMHAALVHGEADVAVQLLERGGRIRTPRDLRDAHLERGQWVGDPIDLAHPAIRSAIMEADEKRRVQNRLAGRDSDDGGEWDVGRLDQVEPPPIEMSWPAPPEPRTVLLMPERPGVPETPYLPDAAHTREDIGRRSGYFGYMGDPLLYAAHRPISM